MSGYIPLLLDTQKHREFTTGMVDSLTHSTFEMRDIAPLSLNRPSGQNSSELALSSTIISFGVKKIGGPLILSAFSHFFKKISKSLKGQHFQFKKKRIKWPKDIQMAGISPMVTNFSIILQMSNFNQYEHNVSSTITGNTQLIKNMSITNDAIQNFLSTYAIEFVMETAANNITAKIDSEYPVIVVITKSSSFYLFDVYFTTVVNIPSNTEYSFFSLPHSQIDTKLYAVDLPQKFSTNGFNYDFFDNDFSNRGLSGCIDQLLANSHSEFCQDKELTTHKIVKGENIIKDYDVYYIITTEPNTNVKITCPGNKQINNNLGKMISIIAISPSCAMGINTKDGTLSIRPNSSFNGKIKKSLFLFEYDITVYKDQNEYHLIFIITIAVIVGVLIMVLLLGFYYMVYYKKAKIIDLPNLDLMQQTPFNSRESLSTIQNGDGRHVSFNTSL